MNQYRSNNNSSSIILAVDCVFEQCSVAILQDNQVIFHAEQAGKRQQTQQILPMVNEALKATQLALSDLSALVFNRGPGAFSSIRINTAVIQALSFAHDIPCVGISSLQVLAQAGCDNHNFDFVANDKVYVILDARMNQVYIGEYYLGENEIMHISSMNVEKLLDYDQSTEENLPIICINQHAKLLRKHNEQVIIDVIPPNAISLAKIGAYQFSHYGGLLAEKALPVYLRNNAWKTLKEQGKK